MKNFTLRYTLKDKREENNNEIVEFDIRATSLESANNMGIPIARTIIEDEYTRFVIVDYETIPKID